MPRTKATEPTAEQMHLLGILLSLEKQRPHASLQQIADAYGSTRENIRQIMGRMMDMGLIKVEKRGPWSGWSISKRGRKTGLVHRPRDEMEAAPIADASDHQTS